MPLQIQGQILGCLNVYAKVRRKFSPEDISLLSVLGDQAALAIHKAQRGLVARRPERTRCPPARTCGGALAYTFRQPRICPLDLQRRAQAISRSRARGLGLQVHVLAP